MPETFPRRSVDRSQLVFENRPDLLGRLEARPWELFPFDFTLCAYTTARVGIHISAPKEDDLSPNLHLIRSMTDTHGLNLTTHRKVESVWERRGWDGTREQLALTRWLVGIGGGALAVQGLRQRSIPGWLLAGFGGSLAWWALTGEGDLSGARRWCGSALERVGLTSEDRVHDESAESFPASDAPSWTPTVGTGLSDRARVR